MIAVDILFDGVFAAVAAIGFGAISDPPVRAFPYIALLAAVTLDTLQTQAAINRAKKVSGQPPKAETTA